MPHAVVAKGMRFQAFQAVNVALLPSREHDSL